ncbi:MAG: hypothetical protein ACRDQ5_16785 [Sciscionella sp.]
MGNLIKSEFRKILTTRVWWALLIPTVLLAFFWALGVGSLVNSIGSSIKTDSDFERLGVNFDNLPLAVIALARSINITTIFPMIFGVLAFASEIQRKTISTTFLTAPSRGLVLAAKGITYAIWGALYGLVITTFAVLGSLATASDYYPATGKVFLIIVAGIISCVLWTLFGVGIGALFGSTVGATVTLLIYALIVAPIGDLALPGKVPGALPNGSSNGLTSSIAANAMVDKMQDLANGPLAQILGQRVFDGVITVTRYAAGGLGAFDWWASGLIFLGWSGVFLTAGMWMNKQRDIT